MYTNIDTAHPLKTISEFLRNATICCHVDINADNVIAALTIIMRHNVFTFDNRYWVQLTGTAMGAPEAKELNFAKSIPSKVRFSQLLD